MMRFAVAGRYKIRLLSAAGIIIKETDWFSNIITNRGMNELGKTSGAGTYLYVGTGASDPDYAATSLSAPIARSGPGTGPTSNVSGTQFVTPPYYAYTQYTWTLTSGVFTEEATITELGIGYGNNNTSMTGLLSGARIRDVDGTPTSINVLPTQSLQIMYEIQHYINTEDYEYTETFDGVSRDCTARSIMNNDIGNGNLFCPGSTMWPYFFIRELFAPRGIHGYIGSDLIAYDGNLTQSGTLPTGTAVVASTWTKLAYVTDSYELNYVAFFPVLAPEGTYNVFTMAYVAGGMWQVKVDPGVFKSDRQTMHVYARLSWYRYGDS